MARLTTPLGTEFRIDEGLIENIDLVEGEILQLEKWVSQKLRRFQKRVLVELLFLHG